MTEEMHATPPPEHRHQRALMTVDFVTVFSIEECRQWLEHTTHQLDDQRIEFWEDDSFTIRRCRETDPYDDSGVGVFDVRFWGTLEARERGTWVWGTTIEDPDESYRLGFPPTFAVVILLALALEAFLRGAQTALLVWLASLAGLGVWAIITWWDRHRYALRVIMWVWETLYVKPPKRDKGADQDDESEDEEQA